MENLSKQWSEGDVLRTIRHTTLLTRSRRKGTVVTSRISKTQEDKFPHRRSTKEHGPRKALFQSGKSPPINLLTYRTAREHICAILNHQVDGNSFQQQEMRTGLPLLAAQSTLVPSQVTAESSSAALLCRLLLSAFYIVSNLTSSMILCC